jgi:hypothetical protein
MEISISGQLPAGVWTPYGLWGVVRIQFLHIPESKWRHVPWDWTPSLEIREHDDLWGVWDREAFTDRVYAIAMGPYGHVPPFKPLTAGYAYIPREGGLWLYTVRPWRSRHDALVLVGFDPNIEPYHPGSKGQGLMYRGDGTRQFVNWALEFPDYPVPL